MAGILPQAGLLLALEPEKAAAIDGSSDNCEPTVRAVPFAFGQLPQTVPVARWTQGNWGAVLHVQWQWHHEASELDYLASELEVF